jgi:hypothetical protein
MSSSLCELCGCQRFTMPPHTVKQLEAGEFHKHDGCLIYHFGQACPNAPQAAILYGPNTYEGDCQDCGKKTGPAAFLWRWVKGKQRMELCAGCTMRLLGGIIRWKKGREKEAKGQARLGT